MRSRRKSATWVLLWAPAKVPGQIDFDFDSLLDENDGPSSHKIVSEKRRAE